MEWIDVKVQYPNFKSNTKDERFLAIIDGEIAFCCYEGFGDICYVYYPDKCTCEKTTTESITHWMPLPKNILTEDFFLKKAKDEDMKTLTEEDFYRDMKSLMQRYKDDIG
jgi:hypothetical protein